MISTPIVPMGNKNHWDNGDTLSSRWELLIVAVIHKLEVLCRQLKPIKE